ncbi:hypothetical protein K492DRAFT_240338 [Lichtheimia hyalospora FSU 10163]|nr:hypothetical protein K492DRAFT_240338 [Lichtheimia hyalospora FSU 10163]
MSLVANYGSSDSETSDVESTTPSPSITKSTSKSALGSLLPPPKSANKSSTSKPVIYVDLPKGGESDDEKEQEAKRAKRQKISTSGASDLASLLPAPKRGYSLARNKKPMSTATGKPSIAEALEQSMTAQDETSSNAKKAEAIAEKKQVEAPLESEDEQQESEVMQGQEEQEEDVSLDYSGPFFRLGAELKSKPSFTKSTTSKKTSSSSSSTVAQVASASQSRPQQQIQQQQQQPQQTAVDMYAYTNPDPNAMYSYDPNTYYQYWQQQQQQQQQQQESLDDTAAQGSTSDDPFADMDDATYTRLTGKRKQRDTGVKIKTINQQDMLPTDDFHRRMKQMQAPKFMTNAAQLSASGYQRKKNNIMALAAQAQSMQEQLNEQYASSRNTQMESRRKYGF